MKYYCENTQEVLAELKSENAGLNSTEAAYRLEKNGKNKLAEPKKVSLFARFLSQMADPMIIILLAAAVVSGITAVYAGESFTDVFIILFVVILNAILGVYQENKAEKAIEALQAMSSATSKVLRDGHIVVIKSEDLVVGDIVILEAGDAIPADGRIIESASLQTEEAALTGESVPISKMIDTLNLSNQKDIPLGDRKNMVYMGSIVVYGRGKIVVTATATDTEMGKIADALTQVEQGKTPLQKKLGQLSKVLSYLVVGISVFVFAFSLLRSGDLSLDFVIGTFMIAVSLAVAAIPEGLVAVVTIVLSVGVTNMSNRNAIIRRLTAVETLGCAQIICSDKTGTLTQNKMTVVEHYADDEILLAKAMALCSDAELDKDGHATGEPTECALVNYASKLGLNKTNLKAEEPRVGEAPFDSVRKMMSTVHKTDVGYVQYTKGAPDEVLKHCTSYMKDGHILPLTKDLKEKLLFENTNMANKALRVLCAAMRLYKEIPESFNSDKLEHNLIFIGLTGMIDPVRPEVIDAIEKCKSAGIRAIMITGDHRDTAIAIATQLNIIKSPDEAITGAELGEMSDEEFELTIAKYGVYARVQPEHKVRIVNMWRKKGFITAMTGDGVNDAPSIKNADIGIGMGITGTDVTKNVADMVLADDNFATIVNAVSEGRRIYDNIRKSIQFLLSSNLSEVLSIFFATVLGFVILRPIHLLWINLITDAFPALALGMEKGEPNLMHRKPRDAADGIFAGGLGADVVYQGLMVTVITIAAYFIGHYIESGVFEISNSADGMTMAFLTMSMAEIFHSFNMRSQRGSIFKLSHQNVYLFLSMIASMILTAGVIYVPFLSEAFGFEEISLFEYSIAMLLALSVIPIVEIVKLAQRSFARRKKFLN